MSTVLIKIKQKMKSSNKAWIKKCILVLLVCCVFISHTVICAEEAAKDPVADTTADEDAKKAELDKIERRQKA